MKQLIDFFERKSDQNDISATHWLNSLTKNEEREIIDNLNLPQNSDVKETISRTLRNFKDPDSEMGISFGTVRIKSDECEIIGTVRIKEGETRGTIRYLGTVRVKDGKETIEQEEMPNWALFSLDIERNDDFGTVKCSSTRDDISFLYRPPEDWEVNILALEKGEYAPEMKEEAFGKYKKKRKGVNDLFKGCSSQRSGVTIENNSSKNELDDLQLLLTNVNIEPKRKSHVRSKSLTSSSSKI